MTSVLDGWGSHIPMLLAAFRATHGAVLEFGAGHFSTPLLHSLCHAMKRRLLTLESDLAWLGKFESLSSEVHELRYVPDWTACDSLVGNEAWSLVLIDHSPSDVRADALRFVSGNCVAIVHDAERKDGGLRAAIDRFDYCLIDKPRGRQPWTAAISHAPLPFNELN